MTSHCKVCKQNILETGNYSFVIEPAKRIPKKVKSHVMSDVESSAWGITKFQKYLIKRSSPRNVCEIKCGSCKTTCKIPMMKKRHQVGPGTPSFHTPVARKKRKKEPKNLHEGLLIPASFQQSNNKEGSQMSTSSSAATSKSAANDARNSKAAIASAESKKLAMTRNLIQRKLFQAANTSDRPTSLDNFLD